MNAMTRQILSVAVLAGPLSALGVALPAAAIDETAVRGVSEHSRTVSYKRSELATADGRLQVEARIRRAAEDICGSSEYRKAGSLAVAAKRRDCRDQAVNQAMSQLGADQLAATD